MKRAASRNPPEVMSLYCFRVAAAVALDFIFFANALVLIKTKPIVSFELNNNEAGSVWSVSGTLERASSS